MATAQVMSTPYAQGRSLRATTTWVPPSAVMHTRPWRSSPLAGPGFSTLPTIISESSEESHENDFGDSSSAWGGAPTRSPSVSSIEAGSVTASASGYGSRNTSVSSLSLFANTSANGTVTSSSQSHAVRPARLTKSMARRPPSEMLVTPPPRARTASHTRPRPVSMPAVPPSSLIPQAYSRASPSPSDVNIDKQPPPQSRDPASNWMSTSPFGPGMTPKFSRLAMASPAVVMPLSAREYRKRKAKESHGKGKASETALSSNHVTFSDNVLSAPHSADGVLQVKISPPSEEARQSRFLPSTSGTQPHFDHPHPKSSQHATVSTQPQPQLRPSSPKRKKPRSRPNTPPRQFTAHPLISPKSSAGTFFSFASSSDEGSSLPSHLQGTVVPSPSAPTDDPSTTNVIPPPRPRPRLRRKSYPDHIHNGARLSLLEAMNRLSQESASLHRVSGISQVDGANRLSVASQASGQTLFYDIVQSDMDGQVVGDSVNGVGHHTSGLQTQSLQDLSSTLNRTGIEAVPPDDDVNPGAISDSGRKGKRNVRTVRISDTVEVSHPPVLRPRKLTKTRPGSARRSPPGTGSFSEAKAQTRTQTHERRASLLPWKSKKSNENRSDLVGVRNAVANSDQIHRSSMATKSFVQSDVTAAATSVSRSSSPIGNKAAHVERHSKLKSNRSPADPVRPTPMTSAELDFESSASTLPRKSRRYTFSLFASAFPRHKREKSNTAPSSLDLGSETNSKRKHAASVRSLGSGTDTTSMSIRTITQGSQSTLTTLPEPYDLTTPASSGSLPGSRRATSSSTVPMLRRLNAQEMATPGAPFHKELDDQSGSTPSLMTNGSTATSSSIPRTLTPPSFVRSISSNPGGGSFIPRPSGLKESYTDTSEEDSDDVLVGAKSRVCMHQRLQSPLARVSAGVEGAETSEDERAQPRPIPMPNPHPLRPGTSSSSLTTATEISESYVSFSTVDAVSTASSRSTSPSPMIGDKRHHRTSVAHGDGEVHPCALCGHVVPRSVLPPFSLPSPMPDGPEMHPMFTVPLVTVPASALSMESRSMGNGARYYRAGRSSRDHATIPVPVTVATNGYFPGPVTSMPSKARMNVAETAISDRIAIPSVKQRRRPQTAPAGTGDARREFMADVLALRTREGSMDSHVRGEVQDHSRDSRVTRSGSKFKTVLKGLLKWNV